MISSATLGLIDAYQRHISPRKGFSCAYRVLHNSSMGCSGYAKHAIQTHGLWRALPLIRARFAACKAAAHSLDRSAPEAPSREKKDRRLRRLTNCTYDTCCAGVEVCSSAGGAKKTNSGGGDALPDCTPDCGPCSCGW